MIAERDRLGQFLGPLQWLLHPGWALLACLVFLLAGWPLCQRPLELGLCAWSFYLVLMAIRLERPWFAVSSLPPLTVLMIAGSLKWGLGGLLLLAAGKPAADSYYLPFFEQLLSAQCLWALFSTILLIIFAITAQRLRGLAIDAGSRIAIGNHRLLVTVALTTGIFTLIYIFIGVFAGTLDRSGNIYSYWVAKLWRADSFFVIFLKLKNVFYFIAPLAIAWAVRRSSRLLLCVLVAASVLMALLTGGRGIVLYPLAYLAFGLWFAPLPVKLLRSWAFIVFLIAILLIPSISIYRGLPEFQQSSRFSVIQRLQLLARATTSYGDLSLASRLETTGGSLYACSDSYLFIEPAKSAPRAGAARLNRIWQAWLPTMLFPNKPPLRDGHIVVNEILGTPRSKAETMSYTSFHCISFPGDLYWRGGWGLVVAGSFLFALFYRLLAQCWYRWAGLSSLVGLAIWVYPATFFIDYPAGSVGETLWIWLWDLPKYIVLVAVIALIQRAWQRRLQSNS